MFWRPVCFGDHGSFFGAQYVLATSEPFFGDKCFFARTELSLAPSVFHSWRPIFFGDNGAFFGNQPVFEPMEPFFITQCVLATP